MQQQAHFQAREPHPQAGMGAALTKGQVAVDAAPQVDLEGMSKGALVAVAGDEPKQHLVASADRLAVVGEIFGGRAPKVCGG